MPEPPLLAPLDMEPAEAGLYSQGTCHRVPRGTQLNAYFKSTKHMWTGRENSMNPQAH